MGKNLRKNCVGILAALTMFAIGGGGIEACKNSQDHSLNPAQPSRPSYETTVSNSTTIDSSVLDSYFEGLDLNALEVAPPVEYPYTPNGSVITPSVLPEPGPSHAEINESTEPGPRTNDMTQDSANTSGQNSYSDGGPSIITPSENDSLGCENSTDELDENDEKLYGDLADLMSANEEEHDKFLE